MFKARKNHIQSLKNSKHIHCDLRSNIDNFDPTLDANGTFSFPSGGLGQNIIHFGADMSSSVHANNKTKNILILGEGIKQG